jgi:capsular polysaccharide biosynthesis protein
MAVVQEPVAPVLPKRSLLTVVAFALGVAFVASTGVGFVADYLDPSYRTPEELTISLGVPTLASLPREAA